MVFDAQEGSTAAPVLAAAAVVSFLDRWRTWRRPHEEGSDPSALETESVVRAGLAADLAELRIVFHRFRVEAVGLMLHVEEGARELRYLGLLVAADGLVPVVRRVHQRLLTRFPDVESDTIEDCRRLEDALRCFVEGRAGRPSTDDGTLCEDDDWPGLAVALAQRGSRLIDQLTTPSA